jgi:hypothetical protein
VHIAGLQVNPSLQNLSSKLKSVPNHLVGRYQIATNKINIEHLLLKKYMDFILTIILDGQKVYFKTLDHSRKTHS